MSKKRVLAFDLNNYSTLASFGTVYTRILTGPVRASGVAPEQVLSSHVHVFESNATRSLETSGPPGVISCNTDSNRGNNHFVHQSPKLHKYFRDNCHCTRFAIGQRRSRKIGPCSPATTEIMTPLGERSNDPETSLEPPPTSDCGTFVVSARAAIDFD